MQNHARGLARQRRRLNGNSNTSHPLSIGNNTINFVPSGDVWQMRLVYSIAGQDIDFRFDNIEIRDMTAANIGSALNAEVVQATHYSPFGAPLAGLAYNKPQETSRKVVVNDNFNQTGTTDGWLRYYPHTTVTQTQGQVRAVSTTTWGTMYKAIQVVKHKNYILRCKIDKGTCTGTIHVPIYNNAGTTFSGFLVINTSGVYEYRFTAHDDIVKVLFEITPSNAPGSFFLLDEITIEEDVTLDNGYRFGFNGQEKDDEVVGAGNSYTAEYWQYDPRLGRRFNIDPKPDPAISPYACFANSPLLFTDILGDTIKTSQDGYELINEALTATLGEGNPFGYDKSKGLLSYNKDYDRQNYTDQQNSLIEKLAGVVTANEIVNLQIVNSDEPIMDLGNVSLIDKNANGYTVQQETSYSDGSVVKSYNVYIARDPKVRLNTYGPGESVPVVMIMQAKPYIRGTTAIHELMGHTYLYITQPQLSREQNENLTNETENQARQIYMYRGKPIGGKAVPHE